MSGEENRRDGMLNASKRRSPMSRFPGRSNSYRSSANYSNYSPSTSFSNQQQPPRRRTDRYKRDIYSLTERQIKQNDTIIRLLKEIRDRLPPNPAPLSEISEPSQHVGSPSADVSSVENDQPGKTDFLGEEDPADGNV